MYKRNRSVVMESSSVIEGYLKDIAEHTEPKASWYISCSGKDSHIRTTFSPPINVPPGCHYEMACCSVETYYSFPNIFETDNAIKLSNDGGTTWKLVKLPTGCYDIKAINTTLKRLIKEELKGKEENICLSANKISLGCILTLKEKVMVDFDVDNSLRTVLGFPAAIYKEGRWESEHIVNILRVNSIIVHCDVVVLSRKNGIASPIIYNFFPNVSPGEKIVNRPKNLIYLPLSLNVISQMNIWLTDQDDVPIDLRGEQLTITFHMKSC